SGRRRTDRPAAPAQARLAGETGLQLQVTASRRRQRRGPAEGADAYARAQDRPGLAGQRLRLIA
ncbi:MAG: hypothetical protein HXY25_04995, partial [Alphaproteobacteria bacterium]|nr:hypothetical protein [Alphaproteobacteria bacterium]